MSRRVRIAGSNSVGSNCGGAATGAARAKSLRGNHRTRTATVMNERSPQTRSTVEPVAPISPVTPVRPVIPIVPVGPVEPLCQLEVRRRCCRVTASLLLNAHAQGLYTGLQRNPIPHHQGIGLRRGTQQTCRANCHSQAAQPCAPVRGLFRTWQTFQRYPLRSFHSQTTYYGAGYDLGSALMAEITSGYLCIIF